jgi:hypothetical protein
VRLQPANGDMADVVGSSNIRLRLARSKALQRFFARTLSSLVRARMSERSSL